MNLLIRGKKTFIYKNIYGITVNFICIYLTKRDWGEKQNDHNL